MPQCSTQTKETKRGMLWKTKQKLKKSIWNCPAEPPCSEVALTAKNVMSYFSQANMFADHPSTGCVENHILHNFKSLQPVPAGNSHYGQRKLSNLNNYFEREREFPFHWQNTWLLSNAISVVGYLGWLSACEVHVCTRQPCERGFQVIFGRHASDFNRKSLALLTMRFNYIWNK